jgi:hypothetical protein
MWIIHEARGSSTCLITMFASGIVWWEHLNWVHPRSSLCLSCHLWQVSCGKNIWTGYMQDHDRVYHVVCDRYHVVRTFELCTCKYSLQPSWSFYSKCRNVLFPMLSLCNNLGLVVCSGDLHWNVDDELVFHIFDFLNDGSILGMVTSFLLIFVWTHTTSPSTYLVWVGN